MKRSLNRFKYSPNTSAREGAQANSTLDNASPFPFGSPLSMTRGSVLSPTSPTSSTLNATDQMNVSVSSRPRVKGEDLYKGRVMFGGANSSGSNATKSVYNFRRHNRLLASAPYNSASRGKKKKASTADPSSNKAPSSNSSLEKEKSPSGAEGMSSTARVILETLEKMSTPLRDASLIPLPRAEKRKILASQLLEQRSFLSKQRNKSLSQSKGDLEKTFSSGSGLLNGPPLRTEIFSPVTTRRLSHVQSSLSSSMSSQAIANVIRGTPSRKSEDKLKTEISYAKKAKPVETSTETQPSSTNTNNTNKFITEFSFGFNKPTATTKTTESPSKKPSTTVEIVEKLLPGPKTSNADMSSPVSSQKPPVIKAVEKGFSFSKPQTLTFIKESSVASSTRRFTFREPTLLSSQKTDFVKSANNSAKNNFLPDLTANVTQNNGVGNYYSNDARQTSFKVKSSGNRKSATPYGIQKLPDVTSTGVTPASILKKGSVLDILGKAK